MLGGLVKKTGHHPAIGGQLSEIEFTQIQAELAPAQGTPPSPVYGTRDEAIRALTHLLLDCDISVEDTEYWIFQLIDRLETADWPDIHEQLTDFVFGAPVDTAERHALTALIEPIVDRLST